MKSSFQPGKTTALRRRRDQQGYALLMIMFFTALLLIATTMAAPRILTEGKREKEMEMVWRGKQYVRGVKMYYRKMGRFPTSIDDLTKPKVGSLRFMRQAYKDPMNGEDGSWRLIYVGPAGQLIGSLKPPQTLQLPGAGPGLGTSASTVANASTQQQQQQGGFGSSTFGTLGGGNAGAGGNSSFGNQQTTAQTSPPAGAPAGQPGAQPGAEGQPAGTDANAAASSDSMSTPQPITPTETATIIGGNIIGVGSKKIAPSLMVYDKAKNYHLFEFIWDPSKDVTIAGQPGMQTGTGLGQNVGAGQSSFGLTPSTAATNPAPSAPTTAPPSGSTPTTPPLDSAPAPQPEQ